MDSIEYIRIGEEGAKTGFGAEQNRPPAIFHTGIILWIGIAEDPPAQGDELFVLLALLSSFGHRK